MQPSGRSQTTSVLLLLALSLYLTDPTIPSCLLYAAITLFFCFETFGWFELLLCEFVFLACSIFVLIETDGSGYVIPILSVAGGQCFHGASRV